MAKVTQELQKELSAVWSGRVKAVGLSIRSSVRVRSKEHAPVPSNVLKGVTTLIRLLVMMPKEWSSLQTR